MQKSEGEADALRQAAAVRDFKRKLDVAISDLHYSPDAKRLRREHAADVIVRLLDTRRPDVLREVASFVNKRGIEADVSWGKWRDPKTRRRIVWVDVVLTAAATQAFGRDSPLEITWSFKCTEGDLSSRYVRLIRHGEYDIVHWLGPRGDAYGAAFAAGMRAPLGTPAAKFLDALTRPNFSSMKSPSALRKLFAIPVRANWTWAAVHPSTKGWDVYGLLPSILPPASPPGQRPIDRRFNRELDEDAETLHNDDPTEEDESDDDVRYNENYDPDDLCVSLALPMDAQ